MNDAPPTGGPSGSPAAAPHAARCGRAGCGRGACGGGRRRLVEGDLRPDRRTRTAGRCQLRQRLQRRCARNRRRTSCRPASSAGPGRPAASVKAPRRSRSQPQVCSWRARASSSAMSSGRRCAVDHRCGPIPGASCTAISVSARSCFRVLRCGCHGRHHLRPPRRGPDPVAVASVAVACGPPRCW